MPHSWLIRDRMKAVVGVLVLAAVAASVDSAIAEPVPLPLPKPAVSPTSSTSPGIPSDCSIRLAEIAHFSRLPDRDGPGACGAVDLVRLDEIVMPDGHSVKVTPGATLACPMAEAVARWVRLDIGAASDALGSRIAALSTADSYNCRTRDHVAGAKISEHATGNAFDVGSVTLDNGDTVALTGESAPVAFTARVRETACARFTTVLGPGADAAHAHHIHVDLLQRRSGYRICQWDVAPPVVATTGAAPTAKTVAKAAESGGK
jgi:hypothetical protein